MTDEDVTAERICTQGASWLVYANAKASGYRKLKRPLMAEERAELVILADEMKMLAATIALLLGERDASLGH